MLYRAALLSAVLLLIALPLATLAGWEGALPRAQWAPADKAPAAAPAGIGG